MIMSIHQQIFARKRAVISSLLPFGFVKKEDRFVFEKEFMNGDFVLEFVVSKDGSTSSKVIDKMNDEEYVQLNADGIIGGYVGDVRLAYEEILTDIAERCFEDVLFVSDQANRITAQIFAEYGVSPDFPWEDEKYKPSGVFRHADSSKWFGLIMNVKRRNFDAQADEKAMVDVINLKRDPSFDYSSPSFTLTEGAELPLGVFPAFHMNHKLWLSVLLDDTLSDSAVLSLVQASFNSTKK